LCVLAVTETTSSCAEAHPLLTCPLSWLIHFLTPLSSFTPSDLSPLLSPRSLNSYSETSLSNNSHHDIPPFHCLKPCPHPSPLCLQGGQTEVLEGCEAMLVQYGCGESCFWCCNVSCGVFERVQLWLRHPLLPHCAAPPCCVPTCGRVGILLCTQVSECFVHWNSVNEDYVVT